MSSGYGTVQCKIIVALREYAVTHARRPIGMPLAELVGHIYYDRPIGRPSARHDRSQVIAVRRALKGLVADGVALQLGQLHGCRRFVTHYRYRQGVEPTG